jgi:hypothetical protein
MCNYEIYDRLEDFFHTHMEVYREFVDKLIHNNFLSLGEGSYRHTFGRKNVVVKIPRNESGIIDNMIEAISWKKYRFNKTSNGLYLAPCHLLPNGALLMRKVSLISDHSTYPEWAYKIDGEQIGLYKNKPVAYDYALDVKERWDIITKLSQEVDSISMDIPFATDASILFKRAV